MSKTVLIVDDEEQIKEVLDIIIAPIADKLLFADDGITAAEICRTNNVNCIVSDLCMPKMDGLELLEMLRKKGSKIPFIFVTGYANEENEQKAISLGAFDFIKKPFKSDHLVEVVTRALNFDPDSTKTSEEEMLEMLEKQNL